MQESRRTYLVDFLRGLAVAADKNELVVNHGDIGTLPLDADDLREAADELERSGAVSERRVPTANEVFMNTYAQIAIERERNKR